MALRRHTLVAASLYRLALAAWAVTVLRMRGMDAGPGTSLALGWYLSVWVTMTAAMMLPSAAPAVSLFAWTAYGLAAYALYRVVNEGAPAAISWRHGGPWIAGAALAGAGLYQRTPLKTACLRNCRSPAGLLLRAPRGWRGALSAGIRHGGYCVGCGTALMLVLFALGFMSLLWMAVVAAAILLEKRLPGRVRVARGLAVMLVAVGLWVALASGSVPGLTQPVAVRMEMR